MTVVTKHKLLNMCSSKGKIKTLGQIRTLRQNYTSFLPVVYMKQRLVAHEEGAHNLQGWDLKGEVKGGDEAHRAEGPPVPIALLAWVVPRLPK